MALNVRLDIGADRNHVHVPRADVVEGSRHELFGEAVSLECRIDLRVDQGDRLLIRSIEELSHHLLVEAELVAMAIAVVLDRYGARVHVVNTPDPFTSTHRL
jgi:hypothetical protein